MQLDAEQLVTALAMEIGSLADDTIVVGIHSGGVWVAERLHQMLKAMPPLGTLAVTLHRDDFGKIGLHPQKKSTDITFSVEGRDIAALGYQLDLSRDPGDGFSHPVGRCQSLSD